MIEVIISGLCSCRFGRLPLALFVLVLRHCAREGDAVIMD
jgi:hypothetical protein